MKFDKEILHMKNRIIENPSHIVKKTGMRGNKMSVVAEELLKTIETKTGIIEILPAKKQGTGEEINELHKFIAGLLLEDFKEQQALKAEAC